mgnify:CR=1 FL=1
MIPHIKHRLPTIKQAASEDEGICLNCGTVQPVVETNPFLRGPCQECYQADVLPAGDVLRALALLNTDPDLGAPPENWVDIDV